MQRKEFESEWCFLQNQFESYEKHSLYIKLASILVLVISEVSEAKSIAIALILLVLWLQDAIWKTFQSRLEPRLFHIEKCIREEASDVEFQFNTEYQKISLTGRALLGEYGRQAIRPTIAFPHVILVLIVVGQYILG